MLSEMYINRFIRELFFKLGDKTYKPKLSRIDKGVPKLLKKSLQLRVVDAGDDEATMAELYALEGPNYSLESYGISFTASPKHADGILVVGAITKNMKNALLSAYSLCPHPKVVIACGDRSLHGDTRFSEIAGCTKDILGVKIDLEIPGNPPTAKDILDSLVSFVSA